MRQGKKERRRSGCSWETQAIFAATDALIGAAEKANLLLLALGEDRSVALSEQAARAASELAAALMDVDRCRLELLP